VALYHAELDDDSVIVGRHYGTGAERRRRPCTSKGGHVKYPRTGRHRASCG